MSRKAYRDSFVSSHISNTIASQIATLRAKHEWTQKQLAAKAGMKQSRISQLEDPNYENIEVGTLRRLASAFDVALIVRFAPFSDLTRWAVSVSESKVAVPSFDEDTLTAPAEPATRAPTMGILLPQTVTAPPQTVTVEPAMPQQPIISALN